MHDVIVLQYQDDFDEIEVLDGKIFEGLTQIRHHLLEKHGGEINNFSAALKGDDFSLIRFHMIDNTESQFFVDAEFKDITR